MPLPDLPGHFWSLSALGLLWTLFLPSRVKGRKGRWHPPSSLYAQYCAGRAPIVSSWQQCWGLIGIIAHEDVGS